MKSGGFDDPNRLLSDSPEVQLLLRERARRIQADRREKPEGELAVLTFTAGGDRFALEIRFVSHAVKAGNVRALPGAPSFLRGIANVRAQILPVLDLRDLLGLSRRPYPADGQLLVAQYHERRPAFLVDSCGAIRRFREEDCGPVPANFSSRTRSMIRFFTPDGLLVLDGNALLGGNEILIDT